MKEVNSALVIVALMVSAFVSNATAVLFDFNDIPYASSPTDGG